VNPRLAQHAGAVSIFGAIVWWWLHPVVSDLSSALPGAGAGDNVTFVWNLWWMRYVLHHPGLSFFSTSFLFYPVGTDLTLHTHTALPALVAALFGPSSLLASQNLLIVGHLSLNFLCSYALAYRLTRRADAAFIGALVFGASPFVGARLLGHFNLIAAWIVPLTVLQWERAIESRSAARAFVCGVAVGAAAYIDYYLFIYVVALLGTLALAGSIDLLVLHAATPPWTRRVLHVLAALLVVDLLVVAVILLAHTDRIVLGPIGISVRTVKNPVTAGWLLFLIAGGVWAWRRVRLTCRMPNIRVAAIVAVAALTLLLPLVVRGARLWREGRYVSQQYLWRSAPAGIDAASLMLGNPYNRWWGGAIRGTYVKFQIDPIEGVGWIPVGALVLAVVAIARFRDHPAAARTWAVAGSIFLVWALGPWLMVLGRQSPLVLPEILLRYVPVVANARMPGRAMVVVYLAVGQLAAFGIASLMVRGNRTRIAASSLTLLVLVDCVPAPPPVFYPRVPTTYAALPGAPGAVCELPLGLRDGFGETGEFDAAIMLNQTVHERPILGGFVARLPPSVVRDYGALPVVSSFLRLSSGGRLADEPAGDPRTNTAQLVALGVRYIVVDTRIASPDLRQYVHLALVLRTLAEEDGRVFYEVQ
jgi:hypothetical protein